MSFGKCRLASCREITMKWEMTGIWLVVVVAQGLKVPEPTLLAHQTSQESANGQAMGERYSCRPLVENQ